MFEKENISVYHELSEERDGRCTMVSWTILTKKQSPKNNIFIK